MQTLPCLQFRNGQLSPATWESNGRPDHQNGRPLPSQLGPEFTDYVRSRNALEPFPYNPYSATELERSNLWPGQKLQLRVKNKKNLITAKVVQWTEYNDGPSANIRQKHFNLAGATKLKLTVELLPPVQDDSQFQMGDLVEMQGLTSQEGQKLNGLVGSIHKFVEDTGRYAVATCIGQEKVVKCLKPENLKPYVGQLTLEVRKADVDKGGELKGDGTVGMAERVVFTWLEQAEEPMPLDKPTTKSSVQVPQEDYTQNWFEDYFQSPEHKAQVFRQFQDPWYKAKVLRLATETLAATLKSMCHIQETHVNDGAGKDTPLVTGDVEVVHVITTLQNHPDIDQDLRRTFMWTPVGERLYVEPKEIAFNLNGSRKMATRVAYQFLGEESDEEEDGDSEDEEDPGYKAEVLRHTTAMLESLRPMRETKVDDGADENTPLVTGGVDLKDVIHCMFHHPGIDHCLRRGIKWTPAGDKLYAGVVTFTASGEKKVARRLAFQEEDGPSDEEDDSEEEPLVSDDAFREYQAKALRFATAALESVRPLRETQADDGADENAPLVTGDMAVEHVVKFLFNDPHIDHELRRRIMWTPVGDELYAHVMTFNEDGERNLVNRVAYQFDSSLFERNYKREFD